MRHVEGGAGAGKKTLWELVRAPGRRDGGKPQPLSLGIQGEDHGQAAASTAGTGWTSAQKFEPVKHAQDKPMQVGETWYIVYRRWYLRWKKARTGEEDKQGRVEEKNLGQVDNTPLCDQSLGQVNRSTGHI
ncbi:hypothetical protein VTO73DRAFT_4828 [Trametes versicolor]